MYFFNLLGKTFSIFLGIIGYFIIDSMLYFSLSYYTQDLWVRNKTNYILISFFVGTKINNILFQFIIHSRLEIYAGSMTLY